MVAILIACLLTGLAPAAYADPPDPTWIGGYWDDDDFDDVVVLVAGAMAIAVSAPILREPIRLPVERIAPPEPIVGAAPVFATLRPRAPPVAFLPTF